MDRYYNSDGLNVYLVLQNTTYEDSYETKMLQKNKIFGILDLSLMSVDGELIPCYNVSGLKEFGMEYGDRLDPVFVLRMFQALFETLEQLQRYILSINNLILQKEFIYMDELREHFFFVYLPGYQVSIRTQSQCLLEEVLAHVNHEDREQADRIYEIYQKVSEEHLDIRELIQSMPKEGKKQMPTDADADDREDCEMNAAKKEQLLDEVFETEARGKEVTDDAHKKYRIFKWLLVGLMLVTTVFFVGYASYQYKKEGVIRQMKPLAGACMLLAVELFAYIECSGEADGKEDIAPEQIMQESTSYDASIQAETPLHEPKNDEIPYVGAERDACKICVFAPTTDKEKRIKQGERMVLFALESKTIGRGETADFRLRSASVSRRHARMMQVNGTCVLEDMHSTNGTFVNGRLLQPGRPVVLLPGDEVVFGNEIFEFLEYEAVNNDITQRKQGENICQEKTNASIV